MTGPAVAEVVLPARTTDRSVGRRTLLFAGTALASIAALEIGARLVLGSEFRAGVVSDIPMGSCVTFDPALGWRNTAELRAHLVGPSFEYPVFEYDVSTNAEGFRDRDSPSGAPASSVRILSLGDSLAWGWGISDGETYSDMLESYLGPDVDVLNAGVPGYSTDQQYLQLLELGPRYRPDIVLLGFTLNDVEGNAADFIYGFGKPMLARDAAGAWSFVNSPVANTPPAAQLAGVSHWRQVLSHSAIYALTRRDPPRKRDADGREIPIDEMRRAFRAHRSEPDAADEIRALTERLADPSGPTYALLERVRRACDELGARLLVVSLPMRHDEYLLIPGAPCPLAVTETLRASAQYKTAVTRRLEAVGAELRFDVASIDHALLLRVRSGENLNVGDGHLTAAGHAVVAAGLEAALRPLVRAVRARNGGPQQRLAD